MTPRIFLLALCAILTIPLAAQPTGLTAETWSGLTPGKSILTLRNEGISTRAPNTTQTVTTATITGRPSSSGTRLRGTLTPPVDDTYTFWVNGADNVALWLSEDGTRFTKRLIASHLGSTSPTEWSKHANQKSIPIALTAGTTYHIEAHVMSSAANGHLSIAWQGRDGNWALAANGATATQSTTQWGLGADKAIDGKTTGTWSDATMTANQQNSWLKVDFAQVRPLNEVVLLNSPSNQNRLSNFRLSALNASGAVLASGDFFTTSGNVGNSFTWTLPTTVDAKSVRIQILGNNRAGNGHLSLLELQAYGPGPLSLTRNFQVIPGTYLSPITADPADQNNNYLSDTWETQTGLSTSTLPGALLEYGDPDQDGIANYEEQVLGSDPLSAETFGDVITRSMWMDLSGNGSEGVISMTNFANRQRYLGIPNDISQVAGIDANLSYLNYGARYRGSFVAPTTGSYTFWLAASGDAQLWLADGTVKNPATNQPLTNRFGKQFLATSGHVTPQRDFDYNASQRSRSVTLVEGQTYYIEVLHKVAQGSLDHVSVAWRPPGQSRSIMPATVFRINAPDPADSDDDGLPDSWETAVGLNPANNGRNNTVDGEYADPDADGLSNLQEYQSGTNPFAADTDGDGISDYDEIKLYGSDPLVSNNLAPVTITLPPLNQYTAATGTWTANPNGSLTANDRRGAITHTFTLTEPGVHEVILAAGAISSNPWITKSLPIDLSIDGSSIARKTLLSKDSNADTLRAITPWLAAGTHTITVLHENYSSLIRLRIDSLTLKRLGGTDIDENGIPDWIADKETLANTLTRIPATSLTSPVSIEGITRQLTSTTLTVEGASGSFIPPVEGASGSFPITPTASINESFFADIPLSTDGPTTLHATYLGGIVSESHTITWLPTNLLDSFSNNTLHIRKGDSLRLTAHNPVEGASGSFILQGSAGVPPAPTQPQPSAQPHTLTFHTAGTHTLTATWTPESGPTQSATLTIIVHSAHFGSSHLVQVGIPRNWTPPTLAATHQIEADSRIVFSEITTTGARQFKVSTTTPINRHVIARLPGDIDGAPSAILARGTVHAFDVVRVSQTQDASIVTQYPDGTWLMHNTLVAVNLPPNVIVRITAKNQGTLFTNGSTTIDLNSTHFDSNGIAHVYYEWTGTGNPTMCHNVQLFLAP